MSTALPITLSVNKRKHQIFAEPWHTLLEVVRDRLGLTGAKRGCNQGVCGACSMAVDGKIVRGCLSLAVNCTGSEITTIEGIGAKDALSPVQQAFFDAAAVQCGFCMPGMILAATALLAANPKPNDHEIRDGLSGNLCRCSGYAKVFTAVRSVKGKVRL